MTVTEAAGRLGVSYDFVLRLLKDGKIKGHKSGKRWNVREDSVKARLERMGRAA